MRVGYFDCTVDSVVVTAPQGNLTFEAYDSRILVDHLNVSGSLSVLRQSDIHGKNGGNVSFFIVEAGGRLTLDEAAYAQTTLDATGEYVQYDWTGTTCTSVYSGGCHVASAISIPVLNVSGLFKAGLLKVNTSNNAGGLNQVIVGPFGYFQYAPHDTAPWRIVSTWVEGTIEALEPHSLAAMWQGTTMDIRRAGSACVPGGSVYDFCNAQMDIWREYNLDIQVNPKIVPLTRVVQDFPYECRVCQYTAGAGLVDWSYQHKSSSGNGVEPTHFDLASFTIRGTLRAGSLLGRAATCDVQTNAVVSVDGGGCERGQGPGSATAIGSTSGGASHAGRGGQSSTRTGLGGVVYGGVYYHADATAFPTQSALPSKWGSAAPGTNGYGRGGGFIQLHVSNLFTLNGFMSARGRSANGSPAYGGGAGGSIWIVAVQAQGSGSLNTVGGTGTTGGGGGGGRIYLEYSAGKMYSKQTFVQGGASTTGEAGGPGLAYIVGPDGFRNLRVDNKGLVSWARADGNFTEYQRAGSTAVLLPDEQSSNTYAFDLIEVYGAAHLFLNSSTKNFTARLVTGDSTGYVHIKPNTALVYNEDQYGKVINTTFYPVVYAAAHWVLPAAVVEWRSQPSLAYPSLSIPSYLQVWGNVHGAKAHLRVGHGGTWQQMQSSMHTLTFAGMTVQDTAQFVTSNMDATMTTLTLTPYTGSILHEDWNKGHVTVEGGGIFATSNIEITAVAVVVDAAGTMHGNGRGSATGLGHGGNASSMGAGGSYGGRGGKASATTTVPYGYDTFRVHASLGSGGTSTTASRGGGRIYIDASLVVVEGVLSCNGASNAQGAGSGGSITINTTNLEGYGQVLSIGGTSTAAGGGSGGRVSVFYKARGVAYWFGLARAYGGRGSGTAGTGGAGTVYFERTLGPRNNTLIIDNNNLSVDRHAIRTYTSLDTDSGRTWLLPADAATEIDELHMHNHGHLAVDPAMAPNYALQVNVLGDNTGVVHVGPMQSVIGRPTEQRPFTFRLGFAYVYETGKLTLPPVYECARSVLNIKGVLHGLENFTIGQQCQLLLGATGSTGQLDTPAGTYVFNQLYVRAFGEIASIAQSTTEFRESRSWFPFQINTTGLRIAGGGHVHFTTAMYTMESLVVDAGGQLVADGMPYKCTGVTAVGNGVTGAGTASGAGHGGSGGRQRSNTDLIVGVPVGSVYEPVTYGCMGGNSSASSNNGGKGGGQLQLHTRVLQNDGTISATGHSGAAAAGGGSGGSVWVNTINMTGSGAFDVSGGSGYGGGGGGRIAVYFDNNNTFLGKFIAYGGVATNVGGAPGGPGTVFAYNRIFNHTSLYIDNNFVAQQPPLGYRVQDYDRLNILGYGMCLLIGTSHIFNADGPNEWVFDEIILNGGASLAFLDANVSFTSRIIIGDRSGILHTGATQLVDFYRPVIDLPVHTYTYTGGTLGLAVSTELHDTELYMEGVLMHVQNLSIHNNGVIRGNLNGRTLSAPEGENHFQFDYVTVQDGGLLTFDTDPTTANWSLLTTTGLRVEGGGQIVGTNMVLSSTWAIVNNGGHISADGLGYTATMAPAGTIGTNDLVINRGVGVRYVQGGSGGGHGGAGGRGSGSDASGRSVIGRAHDSVYHPAAMGSGGGGGSSSTAGGRGGGIIRMNVGVLTVDGVVSANGQDAPCALCGGGSGGSIVLDVGTLRGYGNVSIAGGSGMLTLDGATGGGGGAGGRGRVDFHVNRTSRSFAFLGGGGRGYEPGGAGTWYFYDVNADLTTLYVNNMGQQPLPQVNYLRRVVSAIVYEDVNGVEHDYSAASLATDSGRTWITPESGNDALAGGNNEYQFDLFYIDGHAHVAFLADAGERVTINFKTFVGDRTGVVHVGPDQVLNLTRAYVDLPFSQWVYPGGEAHLAPVVTVRDVFVQVWGSLHLVRNLTVQNRGVVWCAPDGYTDAQPNSTFAFQNIEVEGGGQLRMETHVTRDDGMVLRVDQVMHIEGGGVITGSNMTVRALNITIDDGGRLSADELGHHITDPTTGQNGPVNPGMGFSSTRGASGAGHGGSGGHGAPMGGVPVERRVGQAYGHLYHPTAFGSAGGNGLQNDVDHGGRGGGILAVTVTNTLFVDGAVSANGGSAVVQYGGGGSGGSVLVTTHVLAGYGSIEARGGDGHVITSFPGGGGAGGRTAVYFDVNDTMNGFTFTARGGRSNIEGGGAGTSFVYHTQEDHRILTIDGGGNERLQVMNYLYRSVTAIDYKENSTSSNDFVYHDYTDVSEVGGVAWIMPDAGSHTFADGNNTYAFEDVIIEAGAHLAIMTEPPMVQPAHFNAVNFMGDRTGTLHLGAAQVMDLTRPAIDLPFNMWAYGGSEVVLAPITDVYGVYIQMSGSVADIETLTIYGGGEFYANPGGQTVGMPNSSMYAFDMLRVQNNGTLHMESDPVIDPAFEFFTTETFVEGGGELRGTKIVFQTVNFTIDDGGSINTDELGYRTGHGAGGEGLHGLVNAGVGISDVEGSSGAGHGGTGGMGEGTTHTGQPYGDLYQPFVFGSSGGYGVQGNTIHGSRGGGILWINASGYDGAQNFAICCGVFG